MRSMIKAPPLQVFKDRKKELSKRKSAGVSIMPSDNSKMVAVAQSLGFEKKEAKLFLQLMARFAEIKMPFWKAVEKRNHVNY